MTNLFGTDGVRGPVPSTIHPELAYRLARAAGHVLLAEERPSGYAQTVVIGRDSRLSGPMLEAALVAGFTSVGVHVITIGLIPTPGIAYLVRTYHAMAGVVISASHNPYTDNGIKFFNHEGKKLPDRLELEISRLVQDPDAIASVPPEKIGSILRDEEGVGLYGDMLQGLASFTGPFKAVIDCGNGSASILAESLFSKLGVAVVMLANKPDGVNINLDSGSTHPQHLQEAVQAHGADLGMAFDGDADRFLAVDADGNLVDGDQLMAIYAVWMKAKGLLAQDSLAVTVMSNLGLKKALEDQGISYVETKVGDRYVNEAMEAHGLNLGGEQSGHIIFGDHNTTGDGMISAIVLLNVMDDTGKSLADLAQVMTVYPQVLINVPVSDKTAWQQDQVFQGLLAQGKDALAGQGRILVRASGTEDLLRVMVEGQAEDQIRDWAQTLATHLETEYGK